MGEPPVSTGRIPSIGFQSQPTPYLGVDGSVPTTQILPPICETPIVANPSPPDDLLNKEEAQEFINQVLGEKRNFPPEWVECLISVANRIVGSTSSSQITRRTVSQILSDPCLTDTLRLVFLALLNYNSIEQVSPRIAENPGAMEQLADSFLTKDILTSETLKALYSGELKVEIRFINDHNGLKAYRLFLRIGNYRETIAEYRDGKVTYTSQSPVAKGIIIYLQRLLAANHYLSPSEYTEGTFCRNTFEKLYQFLANKNLLLDFHAPTVDRLLTQRVEEAEQALRALASVPKVDLQKLNKYLIDYVEYIDAKYYYDQERESKYGNVSESVRNRFKAAESEYNQARAEFGKANLNEALIKAHLRYGLLRNALDKISAVLDLADRYRDLPRMGLSSEEQAFVKRCGELASQYRKYMREVLNEILNLENGNNGYFRLDVISLISQRNQFERAEREENQKKKFEVYNALIGSALNLYFTLRRWQKVGQFDPAIWQRLEANINDVRKFINRYASATGEMDHVSEMMQTIDQEVLASIEAIGENPTGDRSKILDRYRKAGQISRALGNDPARSLILSFIREKLRDKRLASVKDLFFTTFGKIVQNPANDSRLQNLMSNFYNNNVREGYGLPSNGFSDSAEEALGDLENAGFPNSEENPTLYHELINLVFALYSRMREHNVLADANPNSVRPLTFLSVIGAVRKVFSILEGLLESEVREILTILSNVSDDQENAEVELAQQLDDELGKLMVSDFRQLRGGNTLTISPRVFSELRKGSALSAWVVTYDDLRRWAPERLPEGSQEGDYFYVSSMGVYQLPPEVAARIRQQETQSVSESERIVVATPNNLAGTVFSRSPERFLWDEPIAAIKLAIVRYAPISDRQVLTLSGKVTARLTATDLDGIVKVFGESNYWILFNFQLSPVEAETMRKVAETIDNRAQGSTLVGALLRRIASGENNLRLTYEEKEALDRFLDKDAYDISEYCNTFANLDEVEKRALKRVLVSLKIARNDLLHKGGLGDDEKKVLEDLASYLRWDENLSINDARLTSEEPSGELLKRLETLASERKVAFDREKFTETYRKAIKILRGLHGQLATLASKYPPEEEGWQGIFASLPLLASPSHFKRVLHNATETISPPSQADYLMAGLPNYQVFEIKAVLYPELVKELGDINRRISALEKAGQNNYDPQLLKEMRNCLETVPILLEALVEINRILLSKKNLNTIAAQRSEENLDTIAAQLSDPQNRSNLQLLNDLKIQLVTLLKQSLRKNDEIDERLMRIINDFERLLETLQQFNSNPSLYIVQVDELLLRFREFESRIALAIELEKSAEEQNRREELSDAAKRNGRNIQVLKKLRESLTLVIDKLQSLVKVRNEVLPNYSSKFDLEIRREEIVAQLGSDRFNQEDFKRLKELFGSELDVSLTGGDRILDWAGSIFSGDNGEVLDSDRKTTHKTIGEVLEAFFDSNRDGVVDERDEKREISLTSLLPQPGEKREVTIAKIALSKFFERLPREQTLDLLKTLPVFAGVGQSISAAMSIASRTFGGVSCEFGPNDQTELLMKANRPFYRFLYHFLSFLAMSSDRHPRMNLSPQIYMMLAGSQKGRKYLAQVLGQDTRNFRFDRIDRTALQSFFVYFREEVLPNLNNPRLAQRINYLRQRYQIPLSLEELRGYSDESRLNALLMLIPENQTIEIYDSYNAPKERKDLSRFVESVLKIVEEINQTQPVEDIENYPITYFDPLQSLRDFTFRYQGTTVEPPREISVIHYSDAPEVGELDEYDWFNWFDRKFMDASDWLRIYGKEILLGLYDQVRNDFGGFIWDAAKGGSGFAINFGVFMSKQIGMGFQDTWGGLGDLLNACISRDRDKAIESLTRISKGLAETTGSFVVFEILPWIFYSDVLVEIEKGDYAAAFGKAIVITAMTMKSMRITYDIVKIGLKSGWAVVENGVLRIKNPEEASRMWQERMREIKFVTQRHGLSQRLGLRLAYYQLNPFALLTKMYKAGKKAYRYMSGELQVSVSRSPIQIQMKQEVADGNAGRWKKVADFKASLRRYRIFERALNTWGLRYVSAIPRSVVDLVSSKKASFQGDEYSVLEDLILARQQPGAKFVIKFTKKGASGQIKDASGQIIVDGKTYLELVEARAMGNFRGFKWIILKFNRLAGHPYQAGSIRQLYESFKPLANVYQGVGGREAFASIIPQGRVFDEISFLQDATEGKGLNNRYTIEVNGRSYELTGRQIVEIIAGGQVNPEVDEHIRNLFEGRVKNSHLQGINIVERYLKGEMTSSAEVQLPKSFTPSGQTAETAKQTESAQPAESLTRTPKVEFQTHIKDPEKLSGRVWELGMDKGNASLTNQFYLNYGKNLTALWAIRAYGPALQTQSRNHYRGYLQVDPTQIPEAIRILTEVAEERARQGKSTCFKFLLGVEDVSKFGDAVVDDTIYGRYEHVKPWDPVIVLYADTLEDIKDVLETLSRREDWGKIEEQRTSKHRRMGTNAYKNSQGKEFRSLNYNKRPGYSESVVRMYGHEGWREHVDGTPTQALSIFDFESEVKRLAIEGSVKEAFEGVSEELRRRFVKAVEIARANGKATTFVIEEGVRFGNGGQQALEELIKILETGKAPSGIRVFVENGTIYFDETMMSRVGRSSSTVSFLGTGTIAKLFEKGTVELAGNGRLSVAEEFKASAEQVATAKELAKAMGLPENSSIEKVQREIGKRFGERWVEWLKGNSESAVNFRKSARYQELLRYIAAKSYAGFGKWSQRAVNTAGFAVGILSFFAVEEILDIIGVENKSARFASVILGGHVVATASTKALSLSVTPAGRTLLTTMVKNPAPALVNGLKNVKWVGGAGNLLMGVGYAVLASNLYNSLLNVCGVSPNSWLRSGFVQFGVAMGGAGGLAELAARTALGRAAIPFAVTHLASTVINLFDSDYEQSVKERAHERVRSLLRRGLVGGEVIDTILLGLDYFGSSITGDGLANAFLPKEDLVKVAREDANQIRKLQPELLEALRSLWVTNDLFDYDGSARSLSFFENPDLPYQRLVEFLNQEVEFKDERPIVGYQTIPGNCSYRYGEEFCGPDRKIPIYDPNEPEVREKSAYEFIMENPNLDRASLEKKLREEFNIKDVSAFLHKVELKSLQNLIYYLVGLEPETVDSTTLEIADNRKLRDVFDRKGRIIPGKEGELVRMLEEGAPELRVAIGEFRKIVRLQALLAGAQPTEVDKQLGLVTADGRINENSPVYTRFMQVVEQTLFAMNR